MLPDARAGRKPQQTSISPTQLENVGTHSVVLEVLRNLQPNDVASHLIRVAKVPGVRAHDRCVRELTDEVNESLSHSLCYSLTGSLAVLN